MKDFTPEQIEAMRDRLHRMVDNFFETQVPVMQKIDAFATITATFRHAEIPDAGYALVVGIEAPEEEEADEEDDDL